MILDYLFRKSGESRLLTSEDLARYLEGGKQSAAGVAVTTESALKFAVVFSCVKVLAESVGQLPLHLFKTNGRQKEKAVDHPLYSVLELAPNEYQTAQEWREWVVACLALHGNAYCQINRVRGTVRELLPFRPGSVTPKWNSDKTELSYSVSLAGGTETLPASEVLHIKLFPLDGISGASPIQYAREAIGLGIAEERHGAGLFARGAQPGGVLQTDQILSKEVQTRLSETFEKRHAGSENAGRMAVLEAGLKWSSIAMPSKDAQWLEGRKFQRSEIAGIYRVPPHLVGDLERATFSNIEHSSLDFVVHSLMPYLTRIEARIALQLLNAEERRTYFAKFNASALLRGDMAARSAFYTQMVQNGALSPNEIREFEDQNPREGGDVYLTPANMLIDGKPPPKNEPAPKADPPPPPAE